MRDCHQFYSPLPRGPRRTSDLIKSSCFTGQTGPQAPRTPLFTTLLKGRKHAPQEVLGLDLSYRLPSCWLAAPRTPQEAPKRPPRGPPEAPKRPPRGPQEAPKRPPRGVQGGPREANQSVKQPINHSINESISQSFNQPSDPSINHSLNQSAHPSMIPGLAECA